jgi:hypothetical protein
VSLVATSKPRMSPVVLASPLPKWRVDSSAEQRDEPLLDAAEVVELLHRAADRAARRSLSSRLGRRL